MSVLLNVHTEMTIEADELSLMEEKRSNQARRDFMKVLKSPEPSHSSHVTTTFIFNSLYSTKCGRHCHHYF